MDWNVSNTDGTVVESITLPDSLFDGQVNRNVLREAILAHQANRRQGTASTKRRSEVRGGGRKPWMQKGTGRARAGSTRSPVWVGGGVVFGPRPRSFRQRLTQRKKTAALVAALRLRVGTAGLKIVDEFSISSGKTRDAVRALKQVSGEGKTLLVLGHADETTLRACRNVAGLKVKPPQTISAFDVWYHDSVVMTKEALAGLTERLSHE